MNGCGHGSKGGGLGAPPGWPRERRGAGGEESPSETESLGGSIEEEDEEGKVTPPPHSPPPEDLPSLASKRGSLLACAKQNGLERGLGQRPARHHSLLLSWYLLTCRG
jgi:hypothetical protein